jgi:vesicle-associated membrane protein 7
MVNGQSLVTNIDKVLERGEKIELLVDKTERLESQAVKFRQKAKEVRQTFCWQNWRNTVVLTVIALV